MARRAFLTLPLSRGGGPASIILSALAWAIGLLLVFIVSFTITDILLDLRDQGKGEKRAGLGERIAALRDRGAHAPESEEDALKAYVERLKRFVVDSPLSAATAAEAADLVMSSSLAGTVNEIKKLDDNTLEVSGAVSAGDGRAAVWVVIFAGGHVVGTAEPTLKRSNLTAVIKGADLAGANFAFSATVPGSCGSAIVAVVVSASGAYALLKGDTRIRGC